MLRMGNKGFGFALVTLGLLFFVFLLYQAVTNPMFNQTEQILVLFLALVVFGVTITKAMDF